MAARNVFFFNSRSADAEPGRGTNESLARGPGTHFAALCAFPHWRRTLSNFAATPFAYHGKSWATVEHAFQAEKIALANADVAHTFSLDSGSELSRAGGAAAQRARKIVKLSAAQIAVWDAMKDGVMRELWHAKFTQNGAAKVMLLSTGDAELWHGAPRTPRVRWKGLEALR